jgi:hypothetical protein
MKRNIVPRIIAVSLALCVTGCLGFAPRYDEVLDEKTTAAYENVAKFLAEIELGKYENADTYTAASDEYAEIQGLLAVAKMRAANLPVPSRGTAARARSDLVSFIDGCKASITTLSKLHKIGGLKPNSGTGAGAQTKCDQAAAGARAMKGASR